MLRNPNKTDKTTTTIKASLLVTATLLGLSAISQAALVTIGDPGNAADASGYGAVNYSYQISATEVSIAEFAASGAGSGNENHWDDGTRTVGSNAPVSYVSLDEAMKYCNWLTTGDINLGAYIFLAGVYQSTDRASALIAYGTIFALPTDDEWYKAAYYTGDPGDLWSLYANGTDTIPTHGTTGGWNYFNANFVNGAPNYTWTAASGGVEQNGTYNMMGNVSEWLEDSSGVRRGGSFNDNESSLRSSGRSDTGPMIENDGIGFRFVSIPEPSTVFALMMSGLIFAGYRLIRRSCIP